MKRGLNFGLLLAVILISLVFIESVKAYNFTDYFTTTANIAKSAGLNLSNNEVKLLRFINISNESTLLLSHLGNDSDVTSPAIGSGGTVSGVNYTTGYSGNGTYLNSTSNLDFPSSGNLNTKAGTIEFWMSLPNWSVIHSSNRFILYLSGGPYIRIEGGSNKVYMWLGSTNRVATKSLSSFSANSWHHFVFSWDTESGTFMSFVDDAFQNYGDSDTTGADSTINFPHTWGTLGTDMEIGDVSYGGNPLNGSLDELRIMNTTYYNDTTKYQSILTPRILESTAFDTGGASPVWGNISWTENLPPGTDIELQVSVSDDNTTWSGWFPKGLFTVTVDDNLDDAYINIYPIMKNYSFVGTLFIVPSTVGSNVAYLNLSQIQEMKNYGWEVGGHSYSHNDLTTLSESALITNLNNTYNYIVNNSLNLSSRLSMAYPYGTWTLSVLEQIKNYFEIATTTKSGLRADYNGKYVMARNSGGTLNTLKGQIGNATLNGTWYNWLIHDVCASGCGMNITDFTELMNYTNISGIEVTTMSGALSKIHTNNQGSQILHSGKRYIKYRALLWSYNGSDTPTLDNVIIKYLPMNISTTGFNGSTTNFFDVANLSNISYMILEKTAYGKINFSDSISLNVSKNYTLNTYVNISNNYISINSVALPELNKSATLTLYNLSFTNPRVLIDGAVCPSSICTEVSYTGNNFTFTVTQFSAYSAEETPATTTTTTTTTQETAGGGYPTFYPAREQLEKGYEKTLRKNWKIKFSFDNQNHTIKLDDIINDTAIITVESKLQPFNLTINETKKLDLNDNNYYDLSIKLKNISNYEANFIIKLVHEEIPLEEAMRKEEEKEEKIEVDEEEKIKWWLWLVLGVVILIIATLAYYFIYKKKRHYRKGH